jgi:hypothetical protein
MAVARQLAQHAGLRFGPKMIIEVSGVYYHGSCITSEIDLTCSTSKLLINTNNKKSMVGRPVKPLLRIRFAYCTALRSPSLRPAHRVLSTPLEYGVGLFGI